MEEVLTTKDTLFLEHNFRGPQRVGLSLYPEDRFYNTRNHKVSKVGKQSYSAMISVNHNYASML